MVAEADGASTRDMEVDTSNLNKCNQFNAIIDELLNNPDVEFRSQQRGDIELSTNEKQELAMQLLSANKNMFLVKFGKHLSEEQLSLFRRFCNDTDRGLEIRSTLDKLQKQLDTDKMSKVKKNRRFQALQEMMQEAYFSETEMMKRAPLLYNELVGQYLTEDERRIRDKATENDTLVQILMEGIERDDARELRKQQAEMEDNAMEEEDTSDEDDQVDTNEDTQYSNSRSSRSPEPRPGHSQWGECEELQEKPINKDEFYARSRTVEIASKQKALLRHEFQSLMYQSFLDGRDDFDYDTVDNNERFDNLDLITQDEEDKYFDSEEPNGMDTEDFKEHSGVSSEDELEIFMNNLQKSHPAVIKLSDDFNNLKH